MPYKSNAFGNYDFEPSTSADNYLGFYSSSTGSGSNPTKSLKADDYSGLIAGLSMIGSLSKVRGIESLSSYQSTIASINIKMTARQEEDAIKRGVDAINQVNKRTASLVGSQRVSYAAQGVQVDSGTAADLQLESFEMGAHDAMTARNNSYREALGYKVQGINARLQADMNKSAAENEMRDTLITGGLKAASYYYGGK